MWVQENESSQERFYDGAFVSPSILFCTMVRKTLCSGPLNICPKYSKSSYVLTVAKQLPILISIWILPIFKYLDNFFFFRFGSQRSFARKIGLGKQIFDEGTQTSWSDIPGESVQFFGTSYRLEMRFISHNCVSTIFLGQIYRSCNIVLPVISSMSLPRQNIITLNKKYQAKYFASLQNQHFLVNKLNRSLVSYFKNSFL